MKKKLILLLIIFIPSLIYFFFELTEANFKKMAYYGPKTVNEKGDTVYYTLPRNAYSFAQILTHKLKDSLNDEYVIKVAKEDKLLDTSNSFIAIFTNKQTEAKLAGLLEFEKYKKEKLSSLPIYLIQDPTDLPSYTDTLYYINYLKDSLGIKMSNIYLRTIVNINDDYKSAKAAFFTKKPIHVFDYFAVLVDKDRHIRGYYDPTFISEVKRMIEEYKHLVLRDEHANLQETNKIEKH